MMILPLIALAGCATGPSLQSRMAAYTGDTKQALVTNLGVPDKQITVNGIDYLAYTVRSEQQIEPGDYGFGGFYGRRFYGYGAAWDAGFPRDVDTYTCNATFMLKDDRVYGFTLRGNDCG
jgi:hypothetical protein